MTKTQALPLVLALLAAPAFAGTAATQEAKSQASEPSAVSLELNALEASDRGCRLTFVVNNALGKELTKAAYEIALFSKDGLVDRLTVLDFRELPAGKTKVRQFDLPGTDCSGVGRVLINDATACEGDGVAPEACISQLKTATKAEIEFGS